MSINAKEIEGITNAINNIGDNLISPNVSDGNFEAANMVDVLDDCARGLFSIAKAIRGLHPKNNVVKTSTEDILYITGKEQEWEEQ